MSKRDTKRPRCLYCGKAIPKYTEMVCAPRQKNGWPEAGWEYRGNMIVTSRSYVEIPATMSDTGQPERRLGSVNVWDGETYSPRFSYFCTGTHAGFFAKAAAKSGVRIEGVKS